MKTFILTLCLVIAGLAWAEEKISSKEISGVVRLIRAHPVTEVFFKDLKDSVIIPYTSKHNAIYEACEESRKKGTAVKLLIHPISREVIGFPEKSESKTIEGLPEGTK